MRKTLSAIALALALASSLAGAATAGGHGVNSLTIDQAGPYVYGQHLSFTATVESTVKYPFVRVSCSNSLGVVWSDISANYVKFKLTGNVGLDAAHDPGFTIGVPQSAGWSGGTPVSCYADVYSVPSGGTIVSLTFVAD